MKKTGKLITILLVLLCLLMGTLFTGCTGDTGSGTADSEPTGAADSNSEPTGAADSNTEPTGAADSHTEPTTAPTTVSGSDTESIAIPIIEVEQEDDLTGEDLMNISLYDTYKDDFMIGTIYTENSSNGKLYDTLKQNFNIITPENIMKPEYIQPVEGTFNFDKSDTMLSFAQEQGLKVHGHTLVWHKQTGNWLGFDVERDVAIEQLKNHITNIVSQYKGQIYSWDVVNEAIEDGISLPADGDWTKCLRKTQWLDSIGSDYIALAFQYAHEADPDAILYYNDYNMDDSKKATVAAAMVKDLIEQGVPVHGIGLQGHYTTFTSPANVEKSIKLFSGLGVKISISELDVGVKFADAAGLTEEQEKKQAEIFAKLFRIFKTYSEYIERITFWGHIDTQSWRKETYPLIYNGDYSPKEALRAINDPETYLAEGE